MATGSSGSEGRRPEDTSAGHTDATQAGRSADQAQRSEERTRESEQRTHDAATQAQASAAVSGQQANRATEERRHADQSGVQMGPVQQTHTASRRPDPTAAASMASHGAGHSPAVTPAATTAGRGLGVGSIMAIIGLVFLLLILGFALVNYGDDIANRIGSLLFGSNPDQQVVQQQPAAPGAQAPVVPAAPQALPVAPSGPVLRQTYAPPADVADQIMNLERQIEKKERMLSTLNPNCPDDRPEYDALVARIAALRQKIADLRATSHEMVVQHGTAPVMQMHRNDGQSIQYSGKGYYTTTAMDPETARYAFDAKRIRAEEQRDAAQREARVLKATRDDRHEELMEELKRNRRLQENPPKQTHVHTHQHAYPTTTVRYVVPAPYCNY